MARSLIAAAGVALALLAGPVAAASPAYRPIARTMSSRTITLTGHDLTIEQLVEVARHGARVRVSPDALRRAQGSLGLMLQGALEGVPIYIFNRASGARREVKVFEGDPLTAENQAKLAGRGFLQGALTGQGFGEEYPDEDLGRAMLVVDANILTYEAVSPDYIEAVVALLNHDITPVVHTRGTIGEGDFVPITATLLGRGDVYYQGLRMPAAEALRRAGLKPISLAGNNDAVMVSTSALSAGAAALLVADARAMLEWHDLIWAMDLNGMNGSLTPLSMPVQASRPSAWPNHAAAKVLDMLRGGYLFNGEDRLLQDPESLRATVWRAGGAWKAWDQLRQSVLIQMNSTDHNPTSRPGVSPEDSWELSTPQFRKFHVNGGKYSDGKGGFILSNSNWDPYPMVNDVEAFPMALNNLMVAVVQRMHRFDDTFFTVADADQVLRAKGGTVSGIPRTGVASGGVADALWQELKPLANPVPPDGVSADKGVADLDAVPLVKIMRARQAVSVATELLAQDLLNAAFWMDIRALEDPSRTFGAGPTATWKALRDVIPLDSGPEPGREANSNLATDFLRSNSPSAFYRGGVVAMPNGERGDIPRAGPLPASKPVAARQP